MFLTHRKFKQISKIEYPHGKMGRHDQIDHKEKNEGG